MSNEEEAHTHEAILAYLKITSLISSEKALQVPEQLSDGSWYTGR
jgi:hypothetical protein